MIATGAPPRDPRRLVIVGQEPVASLAAAIGAAARGTDRVRVVPLTPDRIADFDAGQLASEPTDSTDAFAAIGLSALNYARYDLWAKLRLAGYRCAPLVHPAAQVDASASLGDNVLVGPMAAVEPDAALGPGSILNAGAIVGSSARIGAWCWLARGTIVGAGCAVGDHVVLGSGVELADHTIFPGPGEIDVPGAYRGSYPAGTFRAPEFPDPVRLYGVAGAARR